MSMKLNIGAVRLPRVSFLSTERELLSRWCKDNGAMHYSERQASAQKRHDACAYLIEGLYQVWSCLSPHTSLEIPLHPSCYHSTHKGLINHLSNQFVTLAVRGLETLGWVKIKKGHRSAKGEKVITQLLPSGDLLARFENIGLRWQELYVPDATILLRNKDQSTDEQYELKVPDTRTVRSMKKNLNKINQFLAKQAICLHMSNENLKALGSAESKIKYPLIFSHTPLRRIFSRGSMERGGRFYGGWWENLPSEYRPYLTINGLATGEVDFSEFHPRILYLLSGQDVPNGDLYDDGWRDPASPIYDKNMEPYRSRRKLFKEVFNAILNDLEGTFRLSRDELACAKRLGLSLVKIRKILFKKHPLLEMNARSGIGLRLQYIDSKIAEHVLLELMELKIPCLPVHDSFIVPRHQVAELIRAMRNGFKSVTGHMPNLKELEPFHSDFRLPFTADGGVDRQALFELHENSIHNQYVSTWKPRAARGKKVIGSPPIL